VIPRRRLELLEGSTVATDRLRVFDRLGAGLAALGVPRTTTRD
jgi:hypothetical protein